METNRLVAASVLVSTNVADLLDEDDQGDPNNDLFYCRKQAAFSHQKGCEFIIHVDLGITDDEDFVINGMQKYNCTPQLISTYKQAKDLGATHLLLYV